VIDYLIRGGTVIDGSGAEPIRVNIGIQGDRIVVMSSDEPYAKEVVDAGGLIVCPGFIDTHGHSELTILADGRAEGKISQGITTEINGNCGFSAGPLSGESLAGREDELKRLGIGERWSSLGEYFALLEQRGTALNFATLCGHGNVRASVMGYRNDEPAKEELSDMRRLLIEALREGAMGLSTGLIYPPGIYAHTRELLELTRVLAAEGGRNIYTTHMRSEGDRLLESIEEVGQIGREIRVKVHISHLKTAGKGNWGKIGSVVALLSDLRNDGIQLTCDRYPYTAASTDLDSILPPWVYEGGVEDEMRRLGDSTTVKKIKADIGFREDEYWKSIAISSVTRDENRWMEGLDFLHVARKKGKRPIDALIDILVGENLNVQAIFFSMAEENLHRFLCLPYLMVGSDSAARCFSGVTRSGKPHPRGFGTFPRFIGKYVRDKGLMALPEAIRKITSLPAQTFGIGRRGLIREGFFADIVLFDYDSIIDRATFGDPYNRPDGMMNVFVNGVPAMSDGEPTGSLSGKIVK
jgi:N-acyl-D-amino-acid deacylase